MTGFTLTLKAGNRLALLDTLPKAGVCAELGTFEGDFAEQILKHCSPKRLYVVDLFRGNIESGDQDGQHIHWVDMESMRPKLEQRFLGQPVSVVQRDDVNWLIAQPRGSLDWIYLDSLHEYEHVRDALLAAMDVVKQGGVLAGHDYHAQVFPGVVQAVAEFCARYGMTLEVWIGDRLPSFKIVNQRRELRDYGIEQQGEAAGS